LSLLKSTVAIVALTLALAQPGKADARANAPGQGRPTAFDQLAEQLESGEISAGSDAQMAKLLARIRTLVPAGDAKRLLRYQYLYCLFGMDGEPARAVSVAADGIEASSRLGYPQAEANFHYCRGDYRQVLTTPRDALPDYQAGIAIARRLGDLRLLGDGLSNRGNVQSLIGEPGLALVDFLQAQRDYQDAGETVDAQLNLLNIATAYRRIGQMPKARQYMEQSLDYARQRHDVSQQIAAEEQMGFLELESSHQPQALRHFEQAIAMARPLDQQEALGSAYLGEAQAFNLSAHPRQALASLTLAQAAFDRVHDRSNIDMIALQAGEAHAALGLYAQAEAEYDKAALSLGPSGNLRYLSELLGARARTEQALGQLPQAVVDLRHDIAVREALDRNAERYNTMLMSYQFDSARQDQEERRIREESAMQGRQLLALQRVRRWQSLAIVLAGLLLLGLLGLAWRQWRNSRRLHSLAMTDPLTGIANRRRIEQMMARAMEAAGESGDRLSVVIFDIDHFKRINDIHGHAVGDIVLVRLVAACSAMLRPLDQLGRMGGEEFLLILPETPLETGRRVAERLRECARRVALDDIAPELVVTISLGVAQQAYPGQPMEALLEHADRAMYRAKAAGRDRVELAGPLPLPDPVRAGQQAVLP
jgi:diguanylate cyclase (GGDEF)-like protein